MEKNILGILSVISGALGILIWASIRPLLEFFLIKKEIVAGISSSASTGFLYVFPIIMALVLSILGFLLAIGGLIRLKKYKIFNWMVYLGIVLNISLIILIIIYPKCC